MHVSVESDPLLPSSFMGLPSSFSEQRRRKRRRSGRTLELLGS
jgi:hypothetical protein